jgi:hypothetical protein
MECSRHPRLAAARKDDGRHGFHLTVDALDGDVIKAEDMVITV